MATGSSIQKAAIAADEITNKVPRTPVSSIFIRACRSARFSYAHAGQLDFHLYYVHYEV